MDNVNLMRIVHETQEEVRGRGIKIIEMILSKKIRDLVRQYEQMDIIERNRLQQTPLSAVHSMQFETDKQENQFKHILAVASAMMKGRRQMVEVDEYFTSRQIQAMKENEFDFDKMEQIGTVGQYRMFRYNSPAEGQTPKEEM